MALRQDMLEPWLQAMQPASFRGAGFSFDVTGAEFGRRIVVHEYPDADVPDIEDLGREARRYTLQGWVIAGPGNSFNYRADRDALMQALDQPGPGVLVHPYLPDVKNVVVDEWSMAETIAEGGMARFNMTFIGVDGVTGTQVAPNTPAQVQSAALVVQENSAAALSAQYNVSNYNDVPEAEGQLTDLLSSVGGTATAIAEVIENPPQISTLIQSLIDPIINAAQLRELFSIVTEQPASSAASQQNRQALTTAIQVEAVMTACTLSSNTTYTSSTEALAQLQVLQDAIDAIAANVDDATYVALEDLSAATAADVQARAANLATLTTVTLPESMPAIVLAQRLYGAANCVAAEVDILARNAIANPAFLPSGVPLEVLSDWTS